MADDDRLKLYREKRDFSRTTEPVGGTPAASDVPRFVVQKHDASRLHYDFRIEVDGVLKSWAVPTEDHPLEYIDFEGVIPEGEYGAGTMIVWDTGPYRNLKDVPIEEGLAQGRIEIELEGHKLRGGFALIRTGSADDPDANWLLIKMKDEHADAKRDPLEDAPASVLSGRTLEDVAAGK